MRIKNRLEEIMTEFHPYTDGYRLLMLMHRRKDGADKSTVMLRRVITHNHEEFEETLEDMMQDVVLAYPKKELRVYCSVNQRDPEKAIREFKRRQLDMDYAKPEERLGFYMDIKNRWVSCLMKPSNRKDTTFLIDVDPDDGDDIDSIKEKLAGITRNFKIYNTKNGYHILTQPFNPALLPEAKIHKDGLILLYYY